ncbi:MAG TPA: 4'-phosphopantetheinyl transferase superfamily protein [Vicinamibacterales bacterium]|nr:4'-phosphopantetheinyl transferase superfamily protein [Vicinamibacterales bacterium]
MATADVWIVSLPEGDAPVASLLPLLSPTEQTRASRFRPAADRRSYIYSHAALRVLLGREREAHFEDRPFMVGAHGKPFICGAPYFNLSRSAGRAAIAICQHGGIGVDIEREDGSSTGAGESPLTTAERAWLDRVSTDDDRHHRYLRLWVIREAFVKATGAGLSQMLAEGDIVIEHDAPSLSPRSEWQVVEPQATGDALRGYVAAAVVRRGCTVTWRNVSWTEVAARISSPPSVR